MRLTSSLALVSLLALPAVVFAQPSSGTIFASAGGFAAIEKSSTYTGLDMSDADGNDTVAGGMLGLGVHLTERVTARVEWSLTGTITQRGDVIDYPYYPPEAFTAIGNVFSAQGQPQSVIPFVPESRRSTTAGFALLGYRLPAGRASLDLLAGVGLLSERVKSHYDVRIANPPAGTFLSRSDYETTTYNTVPVVGADVAISLFRHAAIVPQVRVYAYPNRVSVRPGVGVRWTF